MNLSARAGRLLVGQTSATMQPAQPTSPGVQVQYTLASLLVDMKLGDMPPAPGWDDAKPVGREAW
jgi:hypothetical protein